MILRRKIFPILILSAWLIFTCAASPAYAEGNLGLVMQGVGKTLFSAFEIPKCMLQNATTMFPVGLLGGVVQGAYRTVVGTLSGVVDIAQGGAPYAKYMLLFL